MSNAQTRARLFVEHETEFHLGALPTEQSHPVTRTLSQTIQGSTIDGLRMLMEVDQDLVPVMERVFAGEEYGALAAAMYRAISSNKRVFFTGCGATGRLSILLEAAWRRFWQDLKQEHPHIAQKLPDRENSTFSVMAGGDHALIRSVENYEDYAAFGRYQLQEGGVSEGDVVVAITEGGETSFVIGTAWEGVEKQASVFFVYNNPSEILRKHVKRSQEIIDDPRITKLDLATGPMAVAGSTRMQATTIELLVVGSALELALSEYLGDCLDVTSLKELGIFNRPVQHYSRGFVQLLRELQTPQAMAGLAQMTEFESGLYQQGGLITYMTDDYQLDLLTDTTERAPTFSLPPFRKSDDVVSPVSWAFVKTPLMDTQAAWKRMLRRELRGLDWGDDVYSKLDIPQEIRKATQKLDNEEILKFAIGKEDDPSRFAERASALVSVLVGDGGDSSFRLQEFAAEFGKHAESYLTTVSLVLGDDKESVQADTVIRIPCALPATPLRLWHRIALKLVFNTLSTATMARMGRVAGNWMVHAEATNKKLIDRGTRLISELTGLDYLESCIALHEAKDEISMRYSVGDEKPSPAVLAIRRVREKTEGNAECRDL